MTPSAFELAPGDAVQSDDEILDWMHKPRRPPIIRWRPVAPTQCVVDPRLKVHGLARLRIARLDHADPDVGQYQRRLCCDRRLIRDFGGRRMGRRDPPVTDAEIETYARVALSLQVFDPERVAFLREQVAADMANPSEMHKNVDAKDGAAISSMTLSSATCGFLRAVTDGQGPRPPAG